MKTVLLYNAIPEKVYETSEALPDEYAKAIRLKVQQRREEDERNDEATEQ